MIQDPQAAPLVARSTLERDDTVTIPPLVAHGFLALEPLELLYLVTNEYDGTDEIGFRWDDPVADVGWPSDANGPTLSERDLRSPSLAEVVRRLRE